MVSQLSPASPGVSPGSASGSEPEFFQITAFVVGLGACVNLYCCLRAESFFFPQPSTSPDARGGLQAQPLWTLVLGHLPGSRSLDWGALSMAQIPFLLGTTSAIVIFLLFVGHLLGDMGLDYTVSPPRLPFSLWFLLYIFMWKRSFLLIFMLFSEIIAL